MRHAYIVSYDIADPKRLRKVFKKMYGYGDHLQLSVFRCEMSKSDLIRMRAALTDIIKNDEDQILIVDLGPCPGRGDTVVKALGLPCAPRARAAIVI
jgi:CRISPR-associated protein Cas2